MEPDPDRVGGIAWARRTGGALTRGERRRLLGEIVRAQGGYVAGRLKLATGRVPSGDLDVDLRPPDSTLARTAEEACREQSPALIGHSYRTWVFGSGLAALDRVPLDREAFYVACLLHDHGLDHPVAGEDFTIRSANRALACGAPDRVADAITAHATPGATVERDGALGTYVGAGAILDLGGLRLWDLSPAYVDAAIAAHPRAGVIAAVSALIREETRLNPRGRFALLKRCGILPLFAITPLTPR